jgi:hypothetical protein
VQAILDDPPIRIRPNLPAHAGAKEKNPMGSSRFGTFIISPKGLNAPANFAHKLSRVSS